ncbi:MAG TPA: PEP-CTERM sorting domain-containing protein [Verrucomicrobiae bacterium]|nr:PEP-CTERM sorting domain-containing protein [Verrucomicrobiae bacterium]
MKILQKGFLGLSRSLLLALVASVSLLPAVSQAQNIIMSDGGSTAVVNPGNGLGNLGMNSWTVDTLNQNQLNQQWFWYSINGAVGQTLDQLGNASIQSANYNGGINNLVVASYANSQLSATVTYLLTGNGSGSGSADITEQIQLQNIGQTTYALNFYQYSDFNLLGGLSDTVVISGSPGTGFTGALQQTSTGGAGLAEVIDSPSANYAEANTVGGVTSTLYKLNNTASLNLDNVLNAGPGDVTWALQWSELNLAPGGTLDITKDKGLSISIVPEPSTVAFLALGLGALGLSLRRKLS